MAAFYGDMNYWSTSIAEVVQKLTNNLKDAIPVNLFVAGVFDLLLAVVILLGNSLVITAVWKDPLKILRSSPSNYIILSLAIADLFAGVNLIPGAAVWFLEHKLGPNSARTLLMVCFSLFIVLLSLSVDHVMLLTVDRFYAIVTPLHYRHRITKTRIAVAACFIWTIGVLAAVTLLIFEQQFLIVWLIGILSIWLTSEAIIILQIVILYHLHKHSKTAASTENSRRNTSLVCQREKKVFKCIILVTGTFYVCFVPWLTVQMVVYFCQACHEKAVLLTAISSLMNILPFLNSALNPLLYAWKFAKFRATFKYFFRKWFKKLQKRNVSNSGGSDFHESRL